MQQLVKPLLLAALIVALAGCAATVTQTPSSPSATSSTAVAVPRTQAPAGALVAIVTASAAMRSGSDWSDFLSEWQTSLSAAAAAAKVPFVFAKDEASVPATASILVKVNVNDFKFVSTGKKLMLGILAGNASMDVDVMYVELPANKPFGSKKFSTTSSAWEGVFSAVTPKQVQAVSETIVKEVASSAPAQ
jgi:uncharacterized lipoprotein YajG